MKLSPEQFDKIQSLLKNGDTLETFDAADTRYSFEEAVEIVNLLYNQEREESRVAVALARKLVDENLQTP